MARAAVPAVEEPPAIEVAAALPPLALELPRSETATHLLFAAAGATYIAALLAVDHYATYPAQLALGGLTWVVLIAWLTRIPVQRRAQTLGVIVFATIGEVSGSLIWGLYTYRLHNLPLFVPPAHGLVFLTGVSLALALGEAHAPRRRDGGGRGDHLGRARPDRRSRAATSPARSGSRCC